MTHTWTKEDWTKDLINHYDIGYRIGAQDARDSIIALLREQADTIPGWDLAIQLLQDLEDTEVVRIIKEIDVD